MTRRATLKIILLLILAQAAGGQTTAPAENAALRAQLTGLLAAGQVQEAIGQAQQALRTHPDDDGVRAEYVRLHLTLAEQWLSELRIDDAYTATQAVLRVQPKHPVATQLAARIAQIRNEAATAAADVQRLLQMELYEAAIDRLRIAEAVRPDLSASLERVARAAWRGAADDHYLARNFNEAFALYERLLTAGTDASPELRSRWVRSLALALAERGPAPSS